MIMLDQGVLLGYMDHSKKITILRKKTCNNTQLVWTPVIISHVTFGLLTKSSHLIYKNVGNDEKTINV